MDCSTPKGAWAISKRGWLNQEGNNKSTRLVQGSFQKDIQEYERIAPSKAVLVVLPLQKRFIQPWKGAVSTSIVSTPQICGDYSWFKHVQAGGILQMPEIITLRICLEEYITWP